MTVHINANKEDVAKTVLMPGDPLRAKMIAEKYLTEPKQINNVRGMLAYTGRNSGNLGGSLDENPVCGICGIRLQPLGKKSLRYTFFRGN